MDKMESLNLQIWLDNENKIIIVFDMDDIVFYKKNHYFSFYLMVLYTCMSKS